MPTDVIIIGGGPNGLLTACELALAGVRPIVLERLPEPSPAPKANGMVGRVVQALDYRGLTSRLGGESPPRPVPYFQFGALALDMAELEGNALYILPVPQRRIEEVLAERARELGVELRQGHELVGLRQRADRVEIEVNGPDGATGSTAGTWSRRTAGTARSARSAGSTSPVSPIPASPLTWEPSRSTCRTADSSTSPVSVGSGRRRSRAPRRACSCT